MKTLIVTLCLTCAVTNALFSLDWISRGLFPLALVAACLAAVCVGVAILAHRLRY